MKKALSIILVGLAIILAYLIICFISFNIIESKNSSVVDCYVNHRCTRLAIEDGPDMIAEYRQYPKSLFFISSPFNLAFDFPFSIKQIERACTMEAKICPDGSAVGRSGPNCEFAACPAASTGGAQIANPASVNCKEKGGTSEIITAGDGSQSSICKFPDGTKCEEWALFRNECQAGKTK